MIVLCAVVVIGGCGNGDVEEMKSAVKDQLVDPDSAKFGSVSISRDEMEGCIEYNAKNRMGGYSGGKIALMKKQGGRWQVDVMDWHSHLCSNTGKFIEGPN